MIFTQEHEELRRTVRNFVDKEINPHVDEWEKEGRFQVENDEENGDQVEADVELRTAVVEGGKAALIFA